jgi:hypothetical protein
MSPGFYAQHTEPALVSPTANTFFPELARGEGLYALPLRKELVRSSDTDLKFEKPGTNVTVQIDFDNILPKDPQGLLAIAAGRFGRRTRGTLYFISENDIWSASYDGKETRRLTTGGGKSSLRRPCRPKASYIQNGEAYTMKPGWKKLRESHFLTAEWERDVRAERQAALHPVLERVISADFMTPTFTDAIGPPSEARYEPMLEGVETPDEFAIVLHMMIGELETSHAEVSPAATPGAPAATVTPQLGFTLDYRYDGAGLRILSAVPPAPPGLMTAPGCVRARSSWPSMDRM